MIGFGELNEEFGNLPPYLISIEEVMEEGYATNSLRIKIETDTGIKVCIEFEEYARKENDRGLVDALCRIMD